MRPRQPSWVGGFVAVEKYLFPPPLSGGGKEEAENKGVKELQPGNQHRGNHRLRRHRNMGQSDLSRWVGQDGEDSS